MMLVPAGIKVHMAVGYTDLRKGLDGLAVLVEQMLRKDPILGAHVSCSAASART